MKTPPSSFLRFSRRILTASVGALLASATGFADQAFWTGVAGSAWNAGLGNWNTSLAGGVAVSVLPTINTDVFFATTRPFALNLSNTLGVDTSINSLNFLHGSGAVTIGAGNTLTLNAAGGVGLTIAGGSAARTVNAPVLLGSAQTWTNDGAFGVTTLTLGGTIDRTAASGQLTIGGQGNTALNGAIGANLVGGIVKNGTGTLTLGSASNAFSGGLAVNGGMVAIASDGALGNVGNGVTLAAGGTLRFSSAATLSAARVITVNGSAANPSGLTLGNNVTQIIGASQLSGSGTARVSLTGGTSGTLSVEGDNGGFHGDLIIGAPGQLVGSILSSRIFSSGNGATLRLQNAGTLANATSLTVHNGSALTLTQPATAVTGRLGAMPLTFHSGRFQYNPSANGGSAISETFGNVSVTGQLSIAGSSTAGPAAGTTLNFGTVTLTDHATLLFRAPQNGTQGTFGGPAAATSVGVFFADLTPETVTSGTTRSVIPWAGNATSVGDPDPRNFMTYDANGFRPLNTTTEVVALSTANALAGVAAGVNVRTTGGGLNQTIAVGGQAINSFSSSVTQTLTGSATAGAPGDVLTVTSGAMATFEPVTFTNASVNFPNGGYFHLGFPFAITTNSRLTGSGGIVATSLSASNSYELRFTNTPTGGNTFTGGLYANGNAAITFTLNNQLGNNGSGQAAGDLVLGGGQLLYFPAAAATVSLNDGVNNRAIKVNESNGTIGAGLAGAVLQIPGSISGAGQVQFGGGGRAAAAGVVELTNVAANTYSGGSLISTGIVRLSNSNQLGTGPVLLNGGTLQAGASLAFASAPTLVASSTIDTQGSNITLSAGLNGSGGTTGNAATTHVLTKNGAGTLTVGGSSNYAGGITLPATSGTLTISGNGRMPDLGPVSVGRSSIFNVDDSGTPLANRIGSATNLTLTNNGVTGGATVNLTTNATGSTFAFGTLTVNGGTTGNANSSTINLLDGGAGNHTVTFLSLGTIGTDNSLLFSGTTNFGGPGTAGTRVFFATTPTLLAGAIPNATFTGAGGSGQAGYSATRGVILYVTTPLSGNLIDNIATSDALATNTLPVPIGALFTTAGIYPGAANPSARVNTGATINSLILDGSDLTLFNAYAAQAGNDNAANGTLVIGNQITSQNGAKTIFADAAATTPTVAFGPATARFTTTSDLTLAAPLTLSGSNGLIKSGAGALTIAGTYAVTGGVTLNAGALNLGSSATLENLTSTGAGTSVNLGTNALTLNSTINTTFAGNITAGNVTKTGGASAILTLSSPTTLNYSGATTIAAGTLQLGVANVLPTTTAVTIGILASGGGTLDLNGFNQTLPGITVFSQDGADATRISTGTGTLTLNGDLTFLDNTANPGFGRRSTISGAAGGGLNLGGAIRTFTVPAQVWDADLTISAPITNGGILFNGQNSTHAGDGAVVATTRLSAVNSYALGTTVARGVVAMGVAGALPAGGPIVLGTASSANVGSVNLLGFSQTIGALSLATGNSGGASNVIGNTSATAATLTIDSASDATFGGGIGGSIFLVGSNGTAIGLTAANNLSLIKQGAGTQTLTGTNPFAGTTSVNAGTLALGNGGSLSGAGTVTVASGATFAARPGVAAATNALGGALTLADGSTFTMADGATSTLTVAGATTLGGAGASLVFDLGGATTATDQVTVTGTVTIGATGGKITIHGIGATAPTAGPFTLISGGASSTLNVNPLALASGKVAVGGIAYPITLSTAATTVMLNVGAASGLDVAFWKGDQSSTWNTNNAGNTNWATNAGGATDTAALPGSFTDVFFTAAGAANLTSTLGADTTISSLTFTSGSGAVTINAGNTLNLAAVGTGNIGLAVTGGSASRIINAPLALSSPLIPNTVQTWNNNGAFGTTTLTVGGTVSSGGAVPTPLTFAGQGNTTVNGAIGIGFMGSILKTGSGTLTLANASNAFNSAVTIDGGVVAISADGHLGNIANGVMLGAGGTLRFTSAVTLNAARVITVNGTALNPGGIDVSNGVAQILGANLLAGSGAAKVSVTGGTTAGFLSVEGANAGFTGTIQVGAPGQLVGHILSSRIFATANGATLRLQNAGTLANATGVTVNNGSALTLTQPAAPVVGRLGAAPLTFHSGRFQYNTNAGGGSAINDSFGNVTIDGLLVLSGSSAAGPATGTTLNFGPLTRNDHATVALRSNTAFGIGSIGGGLNAGVRFLVLLLADVGGSGTSRNVIPWAAATGSTGATDFSNLVTYDTDGFRQLTAGEATVASSQALWNTAIVTSQNVNLQAAVVVSGTSTVNSLFNSTGTPSLTGTGTLVNNSGAVATFNQLAVDGPTLNFPNGAWFHLGNPVVITGTSSISGAGGVTTSSIGTGNQLRLTNTVANTFTGGLFINGNSQVTFRSNNQLGQDGGGLDAGDLTLGGGQLLYNPASAATVSLNDGASSRAIFVNASNGTIGNAVAGAVLQVPGTISGAGQVQFGGGAQSNATAVVELTNPAANTFTGGSLISAGVLRLSNANQLGTGPVLLNGGTLQAAASLTFAAAPTLVASSTIDTQANHITLSAGLNGSGGATGTAATALILTKNGAGTLALAGDSNFAGTIATTAGKLLLSGSISGVTALTMTAATLELGAPDIVNDAAALTLTGSTLTTAGFSETVGALTLGIGASTLDMGSGASLLRFAASSAQAWTGTLSITNWTGLPTGGGTDQIFFGTTNAGLLAGQIARVNFVDPPGLPSGTYGAMMLSTGELVVPEPGTGALLLAGLGLLCARRRRKP